jgi:GAF domain-containing protein
MFESTREEKMNKAFVKVAGALLEPYDVVDLLVALVEECTGILNIQAGALLIANSAGDLELIASTSEEAEFVEVIQLAAGAGPCVECFTSGVQVSVVDIETDSESWPEFQRAALRKGFRSIHSLPMRIRGTVIGSLNLLSTAPGNLSAADVALAQALADVAVIGILQERNIRDINFINEQLQLALDTRVLVEQAKGVISQVENLEMDAAFNALRTYSRANDLSLREAAQNVIDRSISTADVLAARTTPDPLGNMPGAATRNDNVH